MTPMTPRERAEAAVGVARHLARSHPILWYGAIIAVVAIAVFTLASASAHVFALDAPTVAARRALAVLRTRRGAYDCSVPDTPTPGLTREELLNALVGEPSFTDAQGADFTRLFSAAQSALDDLPRRQPLVRVVGTGSDVVTYFVPRFMGARMAASCHARLLVVWALGAILQLMWTTVSMLLGAAMASPLAAFIALALCAASVAVWRSRRDTRRVNRLRSHAMALLYADPSLPWSWALLERQCCVNADAPSSNGRLGRSSSVSFLWPRVRAALEADVARVRTSVHQIWLKRSA